MKIAITQPQPDSISKPELEKLVSNLSSLGYDGIEFKVCNPKNIDIEILQGLLKRYDLEIAAWATGASYIVEGLSLTDSELSVRRKAIQRLQDIVILSSKINHAPVVFGRMQGDLLKVDYTIARKQIVEGLREVGNVAKDAGVSIAFEPIDRYEMEFHNTVEEVIGLINEINIPNIRLMLDTFHMNIEEPSIEEAFRLGAGYLVHVHFADSNRDCPGTGHIDFGEILSILEEICYNGYVSMECHPRKPRLNLAEEAIRYLRNIKKSW